MRAPMQADYLTTTQVAERLGIKRTSVTQSLWRGLMPEPDMILLGHPLWMPETINRWLGEKQARRFQSRRKRRKTKRPRASQSAPPKSASLVGLDARSDSRSSAGVSEEDAHDIAAALRGEGHHCTAVDVVELAGADPGALDYERRRLQHRVLRKLRGLNQRT